MNKWDKFFIDIAVLCANMSKDRSVGVGAVIVGERREVLSTGWNGFPRGVDDDVDERHERPAKYNWTEHGERNAIFNATYSGVTLKGTTMYLNWQPYPCPDCARAVIQSGIIEVVGPDIPFGGKRGQNAIDWEETLKVTKEMFDEAGIEYRIAK